MNCDQAFDALTSLEASQNEPLARHLDTCPRCRDMADVLSPALEMFAPVSRNRESLGEIPAGSELLPPPSPPSCDWADTAPWKQNVWSARRARRDGLKIVGAVALVAVLTVVFASIGRDDPQSGLVNSLAAAECLRESPKEMAPEKAVAACVSCHLQLTEKHLNQPAQAKAEGVILSCVDCHMARDAHTIQRVASAEVSCLFRSTGG